MGLETHQFFVEIADGVRALSPRLLAAFTLDSVDRKVTNVEELAFQTHRLGMANCMKVLDRAGVELGSVALDEQIPVAKGDRVVIAAGGVNIDYGFCIFCSVQESTPSLEVTIKSLKELEAELRKELFDDRRVH